MNKSFTEDIIKHYLEDKLYEKRGISKEEYINRCKEVWDQTNCRKGDYKIIIDGLYDYSKVDNVTDYNDKLLTDHLINKEKQDKIECHCLVSCKWENGELKEVPWDEKSSSNLEDPLEPEERPYLFALFDVLGFEVLHAELGTTNLYHIYKELIDKVTSKESFSTLQTVNEPEIAWTMLGNMPLRHHYFSDTIIVWTPFLPEFVSPFCARCADIICESILMALPLRGAISIGSAILNKNKGVFLGSPIIETARVESQQNWIGVSFCPSSTEPLFQLALHPDLLIQNYTRHFKSVRGFNKYISLMTLDWPKRARERKLDVKIIHQLQILKSKAPVDKHEYYEQTLSFLQHSLNNNDWYKNYKLIIPKPLETIIKVTLTNGDELEGTRPHFAFKDSEFNEQYFLLIPKENIKTLRNLPVEKHSFNLDTLSRVMYVIPKKALARIQLLREERLPANSLAGQISEINQKKSDNIVSKVPTKGGINKNWWEKIPKDLTLLNNSISKVFIGSKGFEIFIPTLNKIHECARYLIFVNFAIPEGETWDREGIEMLHKIELFSHRDFINAIEKFRNQVDLIKETNDFMIEFLNEYKNICETFIGDINGLLINFDPDYKVEYAPSIMEKERFHLLGLMTKMLCALTQKNEK